MKKYLTHLTFFGLLSGCVCLKGVEADKILSQTISDKHFICESDTSIGHQGLVLGESKFLISFSNTILNKTSKTLETHIQVNDASGNEHIVANIIVGKYFNDIIQPRKKINTTNSNGESNIKLKVYEGDILYVRSAGYGTVCYEIGKLF